MIGIGLLGAILALGGEDASALKARIDALVAERWTKPAEKRFDEIGWADDIRHALSLAKEHRRPLFLFTMDGRVNTGRC